MDNGRLPYAGVELGGTKCVCTLADGPDAILQQETVPTTSPEETLGSIESLLENWGRQGIAGFSGAGNACARHGYIGDFTACFRA